MQDDFKKKSKYCNVRKSGGVIEYVLGSWLIYIGGVQKAMEKVPFELRLDEKEPAP